MNTSHVAFLSNHAQENNDLSEAIICTPYGTVRICEKTRIALEAYEEELVGATEAIAKLAFVAGQKLVEI